MESVHVVKYQLKQTRKLNNAKGTQALTAFPENQLL